MYFFFVINFFKFGKKKKEIYVYNINVNDLQSWINSQELSKFEDLMLDVKSTIDNIKSAFLYLTRRLLPPAYVCPLSCVTDWKGKNVTEGNVDCLRNELQFVFLCLVYLRLFFIFQNAALLWLQSAYARHVRQELQKAWCPRT